MCCCGRMAPHTPMREELVQLHSTFNREPAWDFGTRADTELKHKWHLRDSGAIPHAPLVTDHHRDTHNKFDRDPQWSFGQRREPRVLSKRPGPAAYSVSDRPTACRQPAYGFGSRTPRGGVPGHGSAPLVEMTSPGPSAYDTRGNLGSGLQPGGSIKYSLGSRTSRAESANPGPADYTPRPLHTARVPRWGTPGSSTRPGRPGSAGAKPIGVGLESPGPEAHKRNTDLGSSGLHWSLMARTSPRVDPSKRPLASQYTQFGHHGK